jgi:hypothetical protein
VLRECEMCLITSVCWYVSPAYCHAAGHERILAWIYKVMTTPRFCVVRREPTQAILCSHPASWPSFVSLYLSFCSQSYLCRQKFDVAIMRLHLQQCRITPVRILLQSITSVLRNFSFSTLCLIQIAPAFKLENHIV